MENLTKEDLTRLAEIAETACKKAGKFIANFDTTNLKIKSKKAGNSLASSVVTEVDIKSQEIILKEILPTVEKYNFALLTEEETDNKSRLEKEFFWAIDPLDGTLPFTQKQSGFSVSIALVKKSGEPVIGVVFNPITKNIYKAIKDCGAFKNNQKIEVKIDKEKPLTAIFDRSFLTHKDYDKIIEKLKKFSQKNYNGKLNIISHGGAVANACWVIENAPATYFKFPKKELGGGSIWDYSATACIFNEANLFVSDIFGQPLDLNRKDSTFLNVGGIVFASNKELWEFIVEK